MAASDMSSVQNVLDEIWRAKDESDSLRRDIVETSPRGAATVGGAKCAGERRFACIACAQTFLLSTHLRAHIASMHDRETFPRDTQARTDVNKTVYIYRVTPTSAAERRVVVGRRPAEPRAQRVCPACR